MDLPLARAFAAANDLPALDGGSERKTGGIMEELQEILFGTSRRLQALSPYASPDGLPDRSGISPGWRGGGAARSAASSPR